MVSTIAPGRETAMSYVGGGEEGGIRKLGLHAGIALAILGLATGYAAAQAVGLATMQPGTLNHTTGLPESGCPTEL
jgi:hypothetical protein